MKKVLSLFSALALSATPVLADPNIEEWNTLHSMGCMLLRECTDDTYKVSGIDDIKAHYPEINYDLIAPEFNELIAQLDRIGVGVYVGDEKYFPRMHRGVYHTVGNNFFLNRKYLWDAKQVLEVTRHEAWHTVQDCMAGDLDNNNIAIVWNDGVVPNGYIVRANVAYAMTPSAIPWEAEAIWASEEPYQTVNALKACRAPGGDIWDVYPPTPMTGEWLIDNGFWNGETK